MGLGGANRLVRGGFEVITWAQQAKGSFVMGGFDPFLHSFLQFYKHTETLNQLVKPCSYHMIFYK